MGNPSWLAASAAAPVNSGLVNQFLSSHSARWVYQGTQVTAQTTGIAVYQSTYTQYLAQLITTGSSQTTIGKVLIQVAVVNGSAVSEVIPPLTLSLYGNTGNVPSGSALTSVSMDEVYIATSGYWVAFPLAVTGLATSTSYQLVLSPVGTAATFYTWHESNQSSGASLSSDGVTFTPQTYGFMYQVFDQSPSGQLSFITEDSGARWVSLTYSALNQLTGITEYTAAQGGSYLTSVRTVAYTSGFVTGVS